MRIGLHFNTSVIYLHTNTTPCCEYIKKENIMWTTPAATEMRFGFEVTMYVMNK